MKMLEVIKKLDVKPKDILFSIQAIIASDTDERTDPKLRNDPLIRELQKLLRYKGYKQLDATVVGATDRSEYRITFGMASQFEISLNPEISEEAPKANIKLGILLRQTKTQQVINPTTKEIGWVQVSPQTLVKTSLNLKPEERTIVGISKLAKGTFKTEENKGLSLLISAEIIN